MSNKVEKTIADLTAKITNADKEWEVKSKEFEAQFNREYGFYVGRVEGWKETIQMLTTPDDTEKNEVSPENVVEITEYTTEAESNNIPEIEN